MNTTKFTLLYILALGLFSCNAAKWCATHVPTTIRDSTRIKDSLAITIDTTWFNYHVAADSLSLANKLYATIDSLGRCKIQNSTGQVESNKIKIKYIIRNDSIFIEANTKPYEIRIAQLNTTIERFKEIYQSHYEKLSPNYRKPSWFSYKETWAVLGIIFLLLFFLIMKIFKLKLKFSTIPPFIGIGR